APTENSSGQCGTHGLSGPEGPILQCRAQAALSRLAWRAAIAVSACRNSSISSGVVAAPTDTRNAPASSRPMAFSTWLGPTLPDEQAEPAESATPARSKAICAVSAFMPGIAKNVVLAS